MFVWQNIVVAIIVLTAAAYVARIVWRSLFDTEGGGCDSCHSCDRQADVSRKVLVDLDDAIDSGRARKKPPRHKRRLEA